jgi:Winged helix-turn-helix DNA-binding
MSDHGRKYGERPSHPIYIWNGLLERKHVQKIGPSIWLFLWLINAVTFEKDGHGFVLGRTPIKCADIAKGFGVNEQTVRAHLDRLEEGGYIERTLTPRGYSVRVLNSGKFLGEPAAGGRGKTPDHGRGNIPDQPNKTPDQGIENPRPNKSKQLDKAVEEAVSATPTPDSLNPWKVLGSDLPMGSSRFQKIYEHYCATRNGNPLSDAMERTIQAANQRGIGVPPKFFGAKRAVERREAREHSSTPEGEISVIKLETWA